MKTDSGYPKDTGMNKPWQPLGIPFAIKPRNIWRYSDFQNTLKKLQIPRQCGLNYLAENARCVAPSTCCQPSPLHLWNQTAASRGTRVGRRKEESSQAARTSPATEIRNVFLPLYVRIDRQNELQDTKNVVRQVLLVVLV